MSQELFLLNVSKSYSKRGKKLRKRTKPPTLVVAFYVNESGKMSKKIIRSKLTYFYLKYFKPKYRKTRFTCKSCKNKYETLRKKSEKLNRICPICENNLNIR